MGRSFIFLEREQIDRALHEAACGLRLAIEVADLRLIAMLNILLGRAHLADSNANTALRAFGLALTAAARCKAPYEIVQALIGLAEVELRKGNVRAASEHAAQACVRASRSSSKDAFAAALLARAAVCTKRGSAVPKPTSCFTDRASSFDGRPAFTASGSPCALHRRDSRKKFERSVQVF